MSQTPCRGQPRTATVSIAIPGSIVANCQTRELKTQIAGQMARAATIYHVDEIIVFDDQLCHKARGGGGSNHHRRDDRGRPNDKQANTGTSNTPESNNNNPVGEQGGDVPPVERRHAPSDPHAFLARILQYAECPQYLRRHFFPMHPDLQFAGLLPPVDAPHHVRADDRCPYREGVVLEQHHNNNNSKTPSQSHAGSLVNCGIRGRPVQYVSFVGGLVASCYVVRFRMPTDQQNSHPSSCFSLSLHEILSQLPHQY